MKCLIFFLALLPALQPAAAAERTMLRFCSIDIDFAPISRVDGTGHYQFLLMQAASKAGIDVERRIAPRRRCLDEMRAGVKDGMVAAYAPERASFAVFPMAGDGPDVTKSFGTVRYYAYRRRNAAVSWNGSRFENLGAGSSVGVESAFVFVMDRLRGLGVDYDDGSKTLEQNMAKLLAGRVDAVIGMDLEADRLVKERFPGLVERAGPPFDVTPMYLMVSRQFFAKHPDAAQRMWQAVEDVRNSPAYKRYQQLNP